MNEDLPYILGFSLFPGIGPMRYRLLIQHFGSPKRAWSAGENDLARIGLGGSLVRRFVEFRRTYDCAGFVRSLSQKGIHAVTADDPSYPALLLEIPDAPIVLYVLGKRGKTPVPLDRTVAVVGTRKMSPYGREVTETIVSGLTAAGCTIVSGMAYGVDAVAHRTALESGGYTVAVLGCGADVIAPPSNEGLYRDIISSGRGAVVSEMPPGYRPNKGLFPARNRIISGLSLGVVVTEGARDSGSLITARCAAEQGRDVCAVPGPVTNPNSAGPARLIRDGAALVENAADVLSAIGIEGQVCRHGMAPFEPATEDERRVLTSLSGGRRHVDAIVRESGLTAGSVAAILTLLEIRGAVREYGQKEYGLS